MRRKGWAVFSINDTSGIPFAIFKCEQTAKRWIALHSGDEYTMRSIEWIEVKAGLLYGVEPSRPPQVPLLP